MGAPPGRRPRCRLDIVKKIGFCFACGTIVLYPRRTEPTATFVASPPVLHFSEYTVGNVYEVQCEAMRDKVKHFLLKIWEVNPDPFAPCKSWFSFHTS